MKPILFYPLAAIIIIAGSCGEHQAEVVKETSSIPDSIVRNVQTATVASEDESGLIKLNGKIQPNEAKQAKVYALVSGKIQSVNVELGDFVKKGQVLAVLKSTEVAGISNDLYLAKSNVAIAKKGLEATKSLYEGNLATEQDYLAAKTNYEKAVSELNRAGQVASITGGDKSSYVVKAPISGYVIEKNITSNSDVRQDNNAALFSIADLSNVWIIANVYEADMNSIHLGDPVKVSTLVRPDKDYVGKIDKAYNVLDPATRTMRIRISMENPENELKPEMFATVKVNGKSAVKSLTVPSQAIVMANSKNYVVLRKGNKLSIQEITLNKRVDKKAYISGLSLGDEVVINSQLFLYQALSTN